MPGRPGPNGRPLTRDQMVEILEGIMNTSVATKAGHARHEDWLDRRGRIEDLVDSAIDKQSAPTFTPAEVEAIHDGKPFVSIRTTEPQRELTPEEIEKRVADHGEGLSSDYVTITAERLSTKIAPIEWVIPGMIPSRGLVSLGGDANVGKTRWLAGLVLALAAGNTARMGLPQCTAPASVLWIANEERVQDIERRLKAVKLQHGDGTFRDIIVRGKDAGMLQLVKTDASGQPQVNNDKIIEIISVARSHGVGLIVFDPYVTLSDAIDENSAAGAATITRAFTSIAEGSRAAVLHAHHTPKDRSKDNDWYRGDASAWRGSGAIYSALDCGFTLANWMPMNKEKRKAWKGQALKLRLSRWIVLDTGKIREGEPLGSIVYELIGQEMAEGEGMPIGVCRRADENEAANCLLEGAIDTIAAGELAQVLFDTLDYGDHPTPHKQMRGHQLWPTGADRLEPRHFEKLMEMFETPVMFEGGSVSIEDTGRKAAGKYVFHINPKDKE